MNCSLCGKPFVEGARFCDVCGSPAPVATDVISPAVSTPTVTPAAPLTGPTDRPAPPAASVPPPPWASASPPQAPAWVHAAAPPVVAAPRPSYTDGGVGSLDAAGAAVAPFKDPAFINKMLVGGAICFIPFIGVIMVLGYFVRFLRYMVQERSFWPLPQWDDWSELLSSGLSLFVVNLAYMLPIAVAYALVAAPLAMNKSDAAMVIAFMGILAVMLVAFALAIVIMPLVTLQYARTNQIAAAFRTGEVLGQVQGQLGRYALTVVGVTMTAGVICLVVALMLGVVLTFIPIVGPLAWLYVVVCLNLAVYAVLYAVIANFYLKVQ